MPEFIICPIDGHQCSIAECSEYKKTPELPCLAAKTQLVGVVKKVIRINMALGVYEDPEEPTLEEIANSINASDMIMDVADRLGLNPIRLIYKIISEVNKSQK